MRDYKKYINALRKCAKEHKGEKTFTGQIVASDLCRDTANLLEELEQESRWIKCSDDLPDLDADVLGTTTEYGDVVKVARQKSYLEECGWEWVLTDDIEGTSYKSDEIIAWMPLPEGFEEKSNESN